MSNKDFVMAILVYKMAVKNTNLKMCPLDYVTSQMYSYTTKSLLNHMYKAKYKMDLYWNVDTSSRTLFVREGGRMSVRMSTSRRTSSYVITSDCY